MTTRDGEILAIITGIGAVVSVITGIRRALSTARKDSAIKAERDAYKEELDVLSDLLDTERNERIAAELERHKLRLKLAEEGIDPDEDHP